MIPKIIHYCWFGGKPLPREVRKCIASWEKYLPECEIIEWNEGNFDIGLHPFTKAAYDNKAWAFVSDYARLKIVYEHGGIYLDTDVELIRPCSFLLNNTFYIGVQQSQHLCTTGLGFGATKKNDIARAMLDKYDGVKYSHENKAEIACPYLNNEILEGLGYCYDPKVVELQDAVVYPCLYFDPIAPGSSSQNLLCEETVSIHHYSNSWGSRKDVIRRKIMRLIGQERVAWLKEVLHG